MDPITMMLVASGVKAGGQILGGIGAKKTAQLNAFNMETEATLNKAQAIEMAQVRMEEYELASSANLAAFAAAGRDIGSDRSVRAFMERQQEIVGKDIGRMNTQAYLEELKARQQAAGERRAGRDALISSLFSAAETTASGISDYQKTK